MPETNKKPFFKSYSILFAMLAFFGVGLILLPIVWFVFDNYFHLYLFGSPPPDAWIDDIIVLSTFFIWILLSGGAGGFFQATKCMTKPHIFVWFPLIVGFTGILSLNAKLGLPEFMILVGIMFVGAIGSLLGSWYALRRKRKKERLLVEGQV